MRTVFPGIALGLAVALAMPAVADSADHVREKIEKAYSTLKSYTCKCKVNSNMEGPGYSIRTSADGTIEWARKGERSQVRAEMVSSIEQSIQDTTGRQTLKSSTYSDGQTLWAVTEQDGRIHITKSADVQSRDQSAWQIISNAGYSEPSLKVLPEEKLDGADCFVIEVTGKVMGADGEEGSRGRAVVHFRKDCGLAVKFVSYVNDKMISEITLTDLKINPEIKPERFEYKPPAGAQVQDLTNLPAGEKP
jgi:outer membrane lipoprotein-sorting protein